MTVHVPMQGRESHEEHRGASPFELLFDLTFVVAIAQLAYQLSHSGDQVSGPENIGPYLMVFFSIWWAWINFTWFASAYDTDDVLYRTFAIIQMVGVLVLAAGVSAAFASNDFAVIALGYFVMRVGLGLQWTRVAIEHPRGRNTAVRYMMGIVVTQAAWILWLTQVDASPVIFLLLIALELSVPLWAERSGGLPWHPGHISERYGLFVILLLGESVLAATNGMREVFDEDGVTTRLIILSLAGFVLLVGLWWIYFLEPGAAGLLRHREAAYFWGWGHFLLFAALAGVGAWLEVAVLAVSRNDLASNLHIAYGLAVPVAIVLLMVWVVHLPFSELATVPARVLLPAAALVLLIPLAVRAIGLPGVVVGISAAVVAVIVMSIRTLASRNHEAPRVCAPRPGS